MSEIEFRAKLKGSEEWVYGYYCCYGYTDNKKHYIIPDYASALYSVEIDADTLGRYIRLNDKNNAMIYEGDIVLVQSIHRNIRGVEKARVVFLQQEMGYVLVYNGYDKRLGHRNTGELYGQDNRLTVIGNIYDNPGLLEEVR